jgi:hypothetical protein
MEEIMTLYHVFGQEELVRIANALGKAVEMRLQIPQNYVNNSRLMELLELK